MADRAVFKTNLLNLVATSDTEGSQTYTRDELDGNMGRSFGGKMTFNLVTSPDYTNVWEDAVVAQTGTTNALNTNTWNKGSVAYNGSGLGQSTIVNVSGIAVEFVSALGTIDWVKVVCDGETYGILEVGEGVVIPNWSGWAASTCYVYADAYSAGVDEATVNVALVGGS